MLRSDLKSRKFLLVCTTTTRFTNETVFHLGYTRFYSSLPATLMISSDMYQGTRIDSKASGTGCDVRVTVAPSGTGVGDSLTPNGEEQRTGS